MGGIEVGRRGCVGQVAGRGFEGTSAGALALRESLVPFLVYIEIASVLVSACKIIDYYAGRQDHG